jgi:XTP/dITP diphosphohydrolase
MKTLVFASNNLHKLNEIKAILPKFRILGLKDIDINDDIPETGSTLQENAYLKAKYLYDRTGETSLSEDTGLEVDQLMGAPGVHTARYAGDDRDAGKNMDKLLELLQGITDRSAQFRTVICLISNEETKYFEGIVRGKIAFSKSGQMGFGYDPIFIPKNYENTFADLDQSVKNNISHRAKAVMLLKKYIESTR